MANELIGVQSLIQRTLQNSTEITDQLANQAGGSVRSRAPNAPEYPFIIVNVQTKRRRGDFGGANYTTTARIYVNTRKDNSKKLRKIADDVGRVIETCLPELHYPSDRPDNPDFKITRIITEFADIQEENLQGLGRAVILITVLTVSDNS